MNRETAFKILGVSASSTFKYVKQAGRIALSKAHPDKGGSLEKFVEIKTAYDIAIKVASVCSECEGSGKQSIGRGVSNVSIRCRKCRGSGKVRE